MPDPVTNHLHPEKTLLLDGATGTELTRRGLSIDTPEWSARALWEHPEIIHSIHREYVDAGADIITANTFRTHARNLERTEYARQESELTRLAVELAREAAGSRVWVAGSQAPVEDCYSPELTPGDVELIREHQAMSRNLAEAGVDLILVETQNSIREAAVATRSAANTGLPVFVSFVCNRKGRLLSGESLAAAVAVVGEWSPAAVLANCLPVDAVPTALHEIQIACPHSPVGAFANVGFADDNGQWINTDSISPGVYGLHAQRWLETGASLIGGCCGTTPEHIAELRLRIDQM